MTESKLQMVKLSDIVPSRTNNLQREEWELKPDALQELADSISSKGVISPVLLRPNGAPGKYYLVCGERRFQASKIACKEDIPAFIREVSDEEAFDLQITENLQRQDVHPLKEAQAYKALMDADRVKNSVDELSKRFGKAVEYITQRLAFNKLIAEMKKEFYEGKMLIGHAILFSRLTEQDQKVCMKECKPRYGESTGQYVPAKAVQAIIEQQLVRHLNKSPFNIHDVTLVSAAGSCDNCPKRSGHNTLLFSDVKEKDRCFDGACFALKTTRHLIAKIDECLAEDPDFLFAGGYNDNMDSALKKHLEKNKVKVLKEYSDYRETEKNGKGTRKAFCIAGNKIGKLITVEIIKSMTGSGKSQSKPVKNSPAAIDDQIAGLKRSLEMEKEQLEEEVATKIVERLVDLKPYKEPDKTPLTSYEWAYIYNKIFSQLFGKEELKVESELKKIKINVKDKLAARIEQLAKAPATVINFLLRAWIKNDIEDDLSTESYAIQRIGEQFKGVNAKAIRDDLVVQHNKKEVEIAKKIKDLQEKKKLVPAISKSK
jgi:ParB/RepB/Spo0J family partition protein